jgi:hypothetical protein
MGQSVGSSVDFGSGPVERTENRPVAFPYRGDLYLANQASLPLNHLACWRLEACGLLSPVPTGCAH